MYSEKAIIPKIGIVKATFNKLFKVNKNLKDFNKTNNAIRLGSKNQK